MLTEDGSITDKTCLKTLIIRLVLKFKSIVNLLLVRTFGKGTSFKEMIN